MDTGPDSPILAKETIELAHTINQYSRQRAPYFRDLHPATIALVGFLVERNPISIAPRIPDSWPVDRSTLNNAVKEFHRDVSNLGNSEEFRTWERDLAQRNSNTKIPQRPLGFRRGAGKDSLWFPTDFNSDSTNTGLSPTLAPTIEPSHFPAETPGHHRRLPSSIPLSLQHETMVDQPEETAFTAAQKSELETIVAKAVANALRSSEPPARPATPASTTTSISPAWKTEDLGYFHPDLLDKDDSAVKTVSNQTHYRDVLVFVDRLKDLVTLKGEEVIRANIHASLRGSALAWYTSELSEFERQSIRHMPLENGWFLMLRQRFKMRPSQALMKLADTTFSSSEVRAGKSVRSFAQSIFRYAQAAEITSTFNQITQAWSKLSPQLRRDIPEPTPTTTITEFLVLLEAKEAIWKDIAAQPRYQRRPEGRQEYQRPPPRYNQGYNPTYQPRSQSQGYNGGPQSSRYQQDSGRQPWPRDGPQRPQAGPRAQLLLTDKPANQGNHEKIPKRPWNQHQGGNYPPGESKGQRPSAYQTEPQEGALAESCIQSDPTVQDALPAEYPECPDEEDPLESYNGFSRHEEEESYDHSQQGVSCLHCHQDFSSNNKLHTHLYDCAGSTSAGPTAFHAGVSDVVIESTRTDESRPGYRFRPWRYASAQVFLVRNKENYLITCLDTGCSMTIMDDSFAQELGLERRKTEAIPVKGVGAALVSTEYVVFDVFFPGVNPRKIESPRVTGKITIEAHIVPKLESKLLIGIDVLAPESITLDFTRRTATMASCRAMEFPISLRAKPHHRPPRPVCAAEYTVIPPKSQGQIPVSVKGPLEMDRDYAFEPCRQKPTFYTQAVDSNFAFAHAINRTSEPVVIHRKDRLGYISEFDFTEAFQLGTEAAELASSEAMNPDTARSSILPDGSGNETVTPEGITIYGGEETARRFSKIARSYDIWRDTGPAEIPEEMHMQIPLLEGWEARKPKPRVYPLSEQDKELVDEVFDKLHSQNRMEWAKTHTPSGYPVFVAYRSIPQPDGSTVRKGRVVVDLRGLNKIVEQDVYPLPLQEEIIAMVADCPYITVVDAVSFFYQWMIRRDHQNRVAVVSHRGQEIIKVAIMGYCNSVAYVQRLIDYILRDFRDFCRVYVDDILIASKDAPTHEKHLRLVFGKLQEHNIALSPKKSFIGFPSIKLLGHKVDALGLATPEEKIKAIANLQFPFSLKELETYLGMTGSLRHYVRDYTSKIEPLQDRKTLLLQGAPSKGSSRRAFANRELLNEPSGAEVKAFQTIQQEFASPKFLYHFNKAKQLYVDVDASKERGIGAAVYHIHGEDTHVDLSKPPGPTKVQPVLFLSRRLTPAETRYWPTELEIAGVVWVIRKIRHMIEACPAEKPCVIYTDHSAAADIAKQSSLTTSTSTDRINLRHVRASQYIQQFRLQIFHRPGKSNAIADALSRLPAREDNRTANPTEAPGPGELDTLLEEEVYAWNVSLMELSPEFREDIIREYDKDARWSLVIETLKKEEQSKDPIKTALPYLWREGLLYSKDSGGEERLCIPRNIVPQIFKMAHDDAGHQGFDRTYERLKGLAIYKCTKLLKQYIYHCRQCREYARKRHKPYGSLQPILTPPIPFYCITMDFILGLPIITDGYNAAMAVVDKFSKRTGFIPGKTTWNAEDWGKALIKHLQMSDWGFPRMIISDRDRKFLSGFWQGMFHSLNAKLLYSTAYHPQSDGQTERIIGIAEVMLRYFIALHPQEEWREYLPSLQSILNGTRNASTGCTPHELMYGMKLHSPLNIGFRTPEFQEFTIRKDAAEALKYAATYMKKYYDRRHEPQHFAEGDSVYIRLHKGYSIPDKDVSRKLLQQDAGPFRVIERVGRLAYRLELPPHMRIHDVISVAHLEPAPMGEDPFGRPYQPNPQPVTEDSEGAEYELDTILNKRTIRRGRKNVKQYLVRWKGYGAQWNEWYDDANLPNARELIEEFEERQTNIPSKGAGRRGRP